MNIEGSIKIVILGRGRMIVGYLRKHPELAFHWMLENARIIRRWGTTEGLEQIAQDGPTSETVLDRMCSCTFPFGAVVEIINTTEEKWTPHLQQN